MKIIIEYESETLIPEELEKAFNNLKTHICDNRFEPDKIQIDIERFRSFFLRWIDDNRKII